jgi:hypothetical protein
MLRWLIRKRLAAVERDLGVSVDYVRHILDVSLGAFLRCGMVMPLEKYRRSLPAGPYHGAARRRPPRGLRPLCADRG